MKPTSTIFRFTTFAAAKQFQRTAREPMGLINGDDGYIWVVTGRDYARLIRAGYDATED